MPGRRKRFCFGLSHGWPKNGVSAKSSSVHRGFQWLFEGFSTVCFMQPAQSLNERGRTMKLLGILTAGLIFVSLSTNASDLSVSLNDAASVYTIVNSTAPNLSLSELSIVVKKIFASCNDVRTGNFNAEVFALNLNGLISHKLTEAQTRLLTDVARIGQFCDNVGALCRSEHAELPNLDL
jgi:hypothetical protein